jgi:3-phenylpropionate/trans-cinnamate dioxygenase ferredoxin subunit
MFGKKLKWYPLFEKSEQLESLFCGKETVVYKSFFGEILFVKHALTILAFKNKCPHQGKSLEGCWLNQNAVVCPFHKYHFSLETGRGQGLYLEKYELKIDEKGVFLGKEVWSLF